jgi:protein SCO1/2
MSARVRVACVAALCLAASGTACRGTSTVARAALPFYASADFTPFWKPASHTVGDFSLRTQTGASFTRADLEGMPHIASFLYTRCSSLCPTLVSSLKTAAARLPAADVAMVSYSVTPDLDTPTVLAAFGREHAIDPSRWKLVTGSKDVIYRLARDSYFADDNRLKDSLEADGAILHTEKIVLVDGQGRLRGVYNGTQPFDLDHLVADVTQLLR